MPCSICAGALPEGEWCRACGHGRPDDSGPVEPMGSLSVAIRDAKGGFLSTDGEREREAYRLAKAAASEGRREHG